jgi:hypothetical protein
MKLKEYEKELSRYMWFSWQFLRRNQKYQNDYWNLSEGDMLNKWGFCGDYHDINPAAIMEQDIGQLEAIIERRASVLGQNHKHVIRLQDQLKKRKEHLNNVKETNPKKYSLPLAWNAGFVDIRYNPPDYLFPGAEQSEKEIIVKIDPDFPDNLIIAVIVNFLKEYRKRNKRREKRVPWERLDNYLTIYDLAQQGKSYEQIASEVFPHGPDNKYTAIKNVKNGLRQARKIIARGKII